jgi:hypothetical protein
MAKRWILFVEPWDLVGVFAYAQTIAFFECAVIVSTLVLLSAVLPARFFRQRFAAQGSAVMLLTVLFAVALQLELQVLLSSGRVFLLGVAAYLASCAVACILIRRFERLERLVRSFADRLTVLLYLYVAVTVASAVILVLRNT